MIPIHFLQQIPLFTWLSMSANAVIRMSPQPLNVLKNLLLEQQLPHSGKQTLSSPTREIPDTRKALGYLSKEVSVLWPVPLAALICEHTSWRKQLLQTGSLLTDVGLGNHGSGAYSRHWDLSCL